jgi:hypothetical protein
MSIPAFIGKKSENVAGKYGGRVVAAKVWRESGGGRYGRENIYREICVKKYLPKRWEGTLN